MTMPFRFILLPAVFLLSAMLVTTHARAQSAFGGEIISFNTFGEGLSVTRAKAASTEGTVSNIFFFNRVDEPWLGNEWYEYDWELRASFPENGWSQIRVRPQGENKLISAPEELDIEGGTTAELLHYILIRKDNRYVYDVRRDFNIETYNYNNAGEHDGNSASSLLDGPRVFVSDNSSGNRTPNHIPAWIELDFSLGVTAFGSIWSGRLPRGDFDGLMQVDFTRFYTYTGDELNTTPQWSDEFIGTTLDFGKWQVADWSFADTQFRLENIKVQGGSLFLRINRGGSSDWDPPAPVTPVVTQSFNDDSDSITTSSQDTFVETNTDTFTDTFVDTSTDTDAGTDTFVDTSTTTDSNTDTVVDTSTTTEAASDTVVDTGTTTDVSTDTDVDTGTTTVPNVDTSVVVINKEATSFEVSGTPILDDTIAIQTGGGAFGWIYLLLLGGFLPLQRRLTAVSKFGEPC